MATAAASPPAAPERPPDGELPPRPASVVAAEPSPWRATAISLLLHLAALGPLALFATPASRPARLAEVVVEADLDTPHDLFESTGEDASADTLRVEKLERPPAADAAPKAAEATRDAANPQGAELAEAVRDPQGVGAAAGGPLGGGETGAGGGKGTGDGVAFAKLSAKGKRFVFCIDRSASMNEHDAIEFAKRELIASVEKLQPHMEFQVVFYNESAVTLDAALKRKKELIPASAPNRTRAINAIRDVAAAGGTDHKAALLLALELRPDAIFMLTDAEDDPREIVGLVSWLAAQNRRRRELGEAASVHVIQFWHDANKPPQTAIEELARQNRGSYRLIEANKLEADSAP